MTSVTISARYPDGSPMARQPVQITAMTGPAGAALEDLTVIGQTRVVHLDSTGHATVELAPVSVSGDPIIYQIKVGPVTRHLDLTLATEDPVSWGDPTVLVLQGPAPSDWVPVQGPPGVVAATGLASYDAETQTIDVRTPTPGEVGADPAGSAAAVAGALGSHEGLTTSAHGGIVASTDPRLTDARSPTAHTHSGTDVSIDASGWGGEATQAQSALDEITTLFGSALGGLAGELASLTRVPGLEAWYQALAHRADTIADGDGVPVDVVLFGDSLTSYPSPLFCWPSKAAAGINRAWTTRPSPDQPFHCAGAVASVGMGGTVGGTLVTSAVGRDGRALTNGQTIVSPIGSTATGVAVVYQSQPGGGTLTVRHTDGSGAVLATIDTDGATTRSRVHWITGPIDVTGFPRMIHVTSTGNTVVEAFRPTTPGQVTRWWNCSAFGTKASNPTAIPLVGLSLLSALVEDPAANPKLVILGYGTNQVDGGEFTTQMSALIAAVQDRAPAAQIVAWLPHRGPTWTDSRWAEIRAAATTLGVPIIDAATPPPLSSDGTHPIAPDLAMSRNIGGRLSGNALAYLMADLESRGDVQARNATGDRTLSLVAELLGFSFLRFQAPGTDMTLAFGASGVTVASPIGTLTGTPDGLLTTGTLRLPPMASLPAGPNALGLIANHAGTLKLCTTAGTPGTWTVIGTQT